jgi:hypothetical protein
MRRFVPHLVGEVTDVRFEHSPGRGHSAFTTDNTALDALVAYTTGDTPPAICAGSRPVPHRTQVLQVFFGMVDVAAMLGDTVIATSR